MSITKVNKSISVSRQSDLSVSAEMKNKLYLKLLKSLSSESLELDRIFTEFNLGLSVSDLKDLDFEKCSEIVSDLSSHDLDDITDKVLSDSVIAVSSVLILAQFKEIDIEPLFENVGFCPIMYLSNILQDSVSIPLGYPSSNKILRNKLLSDILEDDGCLYDFFSKIAVLYKINEDLALSLMREVLHEYQVRFSSQTYLRFYDYKESMFAFLPDLKLLMTEAVEENFFKAYPNHFNSGCLINVDAALIDFDFPKPEQLQDIFYKNHRGMYSLEYSFDDKSFFRIYHGLISDIEDSEFPKQEFSFEDKLIDIVQESSLLSQIIYAPGSDFDLCVDYRKERFCLLYDILFELLDRSSFLYKLKNNSSVFIPPYIRSYHGYIHEYLSEFKSKLNILQNAIKPPKPKVVDEDIDLKPKTDLLEVLDSSGDVDLNHGTNDEIVVQQVEEVNNEVSLMLKISQRVLNEVPVFFEKTSLKFVQNKLIENFKVSLFNDFSVDKDSQTYEILSAYIDDLVIKIKEDGVK
ncbi:hypothetical protein CL656_05520 [bacterium]|nr:hypothetical protein [bacterium]|tara:strand:- start:4448 stop:6007 length:1560 start_codon:yes stop_codon:yes gene_type:complete